MQGADSAIVLLSCLLFIALIIERCLEIIKSFYDYLEVKHFWYHQWNRYAKNLQKRALYSVKEDRNNDVYLRFIMHRLRVDGEAYNAVYSLSAKKLRELTIRYIFKVIAVLLGIVIAFVVSIDVFYLIAQMLHSNSPDDSSQWYRWLRQLLTGVAMGLGAGPVHMIIASLERAKRLRVNI